MLKWAFSTRNKMAEVHKTLSKVINRQNKKIAIIYYIQVFFFFPFFGHTHSIWKSLDQGSNPNQNFDLHHSCSNTGSLAHCTELWTGASTETSRFINLLHHSENSHKMCKVSRRKKKSWKNNYTYFSSVTYNIKRKNLRQQKYKRRKGWSLHR